MRLCAVDPGKTVAALASFQDDALVACHLVRRDALEETLRAFAPAKYDRLVVEVPQVYRTGRGQGDPNDLVDVALVAGAAAATIGGELTLVRPRRWKGQAPKDVHNRRVLSKLDERERGIVENCGPRYLRHNVVDAVGLGLWKLRR